MLKKNRRGWNNPQDIFSSTEQKKVNHCRKHFRALQDLSNTAMLEVVKIRKLSPRLGIAVIPLGSDHRYDAAEKMTL